MANENPPSALPDGRVLAKVLKPFQYNGVQLKEGDVVDFNEERAVNHMRAGDVERNEALINKIKQRRIDAAEAAKSDASQDW